MEQVSIEQALQYCLENPDNLSAEQLLSKFPRYREELEPLLAFDTRLNSALPREMPAESKALVKQRLINRVAATQADHALEKAQEPLLEPAPTGLARIPRWQRRMFAGLAAVLALAFLWWQAAISLPGNPLYPTKLATEDVLLNFASDTPSLIRGHIELGNLRLVDIRTLQVAGALNQASPAVDNYRHHIGNCLNLWQQRQDDSDTGLAKLIYASSVAGQRTLSLFGGANTIPEELRANILDTTSTIDQLQSSSASILRDAKIDLDPVLEELGGTLGNLLDPVPGMASPTVTPAAAPTAGTTPSAPVPTVVLTVLPTPSGPLPPSDPTLTAVLLAAQTVVAEGRPPESVAAAQTVVSAPAGTPLSASGADAVSTILARSTLTATVGPLVTVTTLPTVTVPGEAQATLTTVPSVVLPTVGRLISATPAVRTALPTVTFRLPVSPTTLLRTPTNLVPPDSDGAPSQSPTPLLPISIQP